MTAPVSPSHPAERVDVAVLGAGIAGLTVARELLRRGHRVTLLEKAGAPGGLARTFARDGFRWDLGGHRFHSNNPAVVDWLRELLGPELLTVPRVSHIVLGGRPVDYPLSFPDALSAFPPGRAAGMLLSFGLAQWRERGRPDRSFEDWVVKRFGWGIYRAFFEPYTRKVWGIPPARLSAEWAAQRIGIPGFWEALRGALRPPADPPPTAISRFYYPRLGFGQIPETLAASIQALGGELRLNATPVRLAPAPPGADGSGLRLAWTEAGAQGAVGRRHELTARHVVSTIPLDPLLALLPGEPPAPALAYRGLICVFLALDRPRVSADSWTYFPDPDLLFGRVHEPKNWSPALVPGADVSSLGVEIFTGPGESVWSWPDERLVETTVAQLAALGRLEPTEVRAAHVVRVPHAYPIYELGYAARLAGVRQWLAQWPTIHLIGRTGSFRYLNSDGVVEDAFRFLEVVDPSPAPLPALAAEVGRWV